MTCWVLARDGDCIFCPNCRRFSQNTVLDTPFNLYNLFDGFLFVQPVNEEINVGGRGDRLMVVLSQSFLGFVVLSWDR